MNPYTVLTADAIERSQEQEERFEADFARILVDEQLSDESNDEPNEE